MTRKQATIAVRSGLNDDEQYGCVVPPIHLSSTYNFTGPRELHHMTRKQATIAVRSGLNDDEQYGCVVPPIHLSSTYNFTGFNEPRAHDA